MSMAGDPKLHAMLHTGALAALAGLEGDHRDVTADPERRLLERKQDGGPKVLAPAGPGPRSGLAAAPERPSAEERLEDLADVGEREGLGPAPPIEVVALPLVRVRQ